METSKFRPLQDWVVVKLDPPKVSKVRLIQIVEVEEKNKVITGVVVAVGPGKWCKANPQVREPVGASVGERVAFFSANFLTSMGELLLETIQKHQEDTGMIRGNDILFVVDVDAEFEIG
jgi:co-chaperonin GroES (HSP10)